MFCDSKRSGRLQKTTLRDDHGMRCINELRQENVGCFTRKRYENMSQYLCEMLGHGIWGLKSSVEATPDTWDGKKQSGLCQTTSPLDSLAQWKKVSFSDDSIMHEFIPRKRHIRWPVGKRLDE
ncbi:hypothetical protein NP493_114g04002 [Ridgeia piscesae]|uniref:Uncharacterized protein n=1 Tax=Ridgeia piscesae TaxID=27915 RepID=A0AAD9UHA3_RIDPI|nr:hypothetical protein NP493_114g04002 [Ridgeia piscesae]